MQTFGLMGILAGFIGHDEDKLEYHYRLNQAGCQKCFTKHGHQLLYAQWHNVDYLLISKNYSAVEVNKKVCSVYGRENTYSNCFMMAHRVCYRRVKLKFIDYETTLSING